MDSNKGIVVAYNMAALHPMLFIMGSIVWICRHPNRKEVATTTAAKELARTNNNVVPAAEHRLSVRAEDHAGKDDDDDDDESSTNLSLSDAKKEHLGGAHDQATTSFATITLPFCEIVVVVDVDDQDNDNNKNDTVSVLSDDVDADIVAESSNNIHATSLFVGHFSTLGNKTEVMHGTL